MVFPERAPLERRGSQARLPMRPSLPIVSTGSHGSKAQAMQGLGNRRVLSEDSIVGRSHTFSFGCKVLEDFNGTSAPKSLYFKGMPLAVEVHPTDFRCSIRDRGT